MNCWRDCDFGVRRRRLLLSFLACPLHLPKKACPGTTAPRDLEMPGVRRLDVAFFLAPIACKRKRCRAALQRRCGKDTLECDGLTSLSFFLGTHCTCQSGVEPPQSLHIVRHSWPTSIRRCSNEKGTQQHCWMQRSAAGEMLGCRAAGEAWRDDDGIRICLPG